MRHPLKKSSLNVRGAQSDAKPMVRASASRRRKVAGIEENLATVSFPVKCARCGQESLVDFPELVIVTALTRWGHMNLYAPCHDTPWSAQPHELDAIRSYLGETWLMSALARTGLALPDRHPIH